MGGVVGGVGDHLACHGDDVENREAEAVGRGQLGVDVGVRGGGDDLEADVVWAGDGGGAAVEAGVEAVEGARVALEGARVGGDAGGCLMLDCCQLSRVRSALRSPLLLLCADACAAADVCAGCADDLSLMRRRRARRRSLSWSRMLFA